MPRFARQRAIDISRRVTSGEGSAYGTAADGADELAPLPFDLRELCHFTCARQLQPPSQPLTGDSHAHVIAPAVVFAESLGYTVTFEPIAGSARGWCDPKHRKIVVDSGVAPNARLRTLVHEAIHALGIDYQQHPRAQAEVIVDTTTLVVLGGLGLDISGETVPYVAGWGEDGALDAVTQFAALIDALARRVEAALSTPGGTQETAAAA